MKKFISKAALTKMWAAILTTILVLVISQDLIFPLSPLQQLEQKFIDYRFQERGEIPFKDSADVIILEITQDSYDQIPSPYNSWPWPRTYFSKVIENLNEAGVAAIGIDIVMSNKDQFSDENDRALFETIKKYKNVVVAGKIDIESEAAFANLSEQFIVRNFKENYSSLFYDADSSVGIVQAVSDNDGVYRRYAPYIYSAVNNKKVPSFAYALLNKYFNKSSNYTAEKSYGKFIYENVEIPEFEESTILVNYYGSNGKFPRVKFIDVLDDSEFTTIDEADFETELNTWDDPDYGLKFSNKFKNKIVLIGSTMPEDKDLVPVSFSPGEREGDNLLYGVEYHANAVQNFLDNNFLYTLPKSLVIFSLIILTMGFFLLTSSLKRIKSKKVFYIEAGIIVFVLMLLFLLFQLAFILFDSQNLIIPIVDPAIAILFGYIGSTAFEFFAERKKSSMMKSMFSQYVSTHLVNELIANPDKLRLGGEKKNLTILFSDIAGFTSFSEGKSAEEVVTFINQFLDEMSESVLNFNGTLDKYLGDSVMAFWGAPIEIKDHALLACKCALDMKKRLEVLNDKWNSGNTPIKMRIGINSGDVVVGNIGGKKRFDYTVMGDNVNLASRLEGANKQYGTSIMINESTYENIKDDFFMRRVDCIKVKGKQNAVNVYEIISEKSDSNNHFESYEKGLEEYKKGNFKEALKLFNEQISKNYDCVSEVYIKRCEYYIANPPLDWEGVTTLTEK